MSEGPGLSTSPAGSRRLLQLRHLLQSQGVQAETQITSPAEAATNITNAIREAIASGSFADSLGKGALSIQVDLSETAVELYGSPELTARVAPGTTKESAVGFVYSRLTYVITA